LKAIHYEVARPMIWIQSIEVRVGKSKVFVVLPNSSRTTIGEGYLSLFLEKWNHPGQKACIGVIVGLCNPDIAATRHPHALVPLFEYAPGILGIVLDSSPGIVLVGRQNLPANVRRAIIQQNYFEILVRLP